MTASNAPRHRSSDLSLGGLDDLPFFIGTTSR